MPRFYDMAETAPGKIDTLTSLRFFAAFAIVLYHIPYVLPTLYRGGAFAQMGIGVDFFFVLSGYVLGITYGERANWSAADYFRRRFARIYPVYLLTTVMWVVLLLNYWQIPAQDKFNSGIAHLLLVHAFLSGPLYTLGFNAPAWTISNEAFFYAVFPFVRRRWAPLVTIATLALYIFLYRASFDALNAVYPNFFGYFPLATFWKFGLGVALAQLWTPRTLGYLVGTVLELAAVALMLFAAVHGFPLPGDLGDIARASVTLFTIAVFACQSGALSRLFRLPAMVLLGDASYSLYLWHHMLMLYAAQFLPIDPVGRFGRIALTMAIIFPIILLSVATYRWFERPLRRWIAGRPKDENGARSDVESAPAFARWPALEHHRARPN